MKKLLIGAWAIGILLSCLFLPGKASAVPDWLSDFNESGAEAVSLTGDSDEVIATLLFEETKWEDSHEFGIYGFKLTDDGIEVTDMLPIFYGSATSLDTTTIHFDISSHQVWLDGSNDVKNIGPTFGFYLKTQKDNSQTFYSQTALNGDDTDHALIYELGGDTLILDEFYPDVVIAFEDWKGGGDGDFNDIVIGLQGVSAVPEPATLILFGTGLVGFASMARKKIKRS